MPCGGPTQQPEPRSKRYGPKWQRTAFLGVFFFPGRTRPFIYTSGWSGQFRCQKSAPADLRSFRDFSGHHKTAAAAVGVCQPAATTTNVSNNNNEQAGKRSRAQVRGAPGQGGETPSPPRAWVCGRLPAVCHRSPLILLNAASVCLSVWHAGTRAHACVGIYRVPVACLWRRCVRLWARGPCVSRLCAWAICGAWAFVRACVCVTRLRARLRVWPGACLRA